MNHCRQTTTILLKLILDLYKNNGKINVHCSEVKSSVNGKYYCNNDIILTGHYCFFFCAYPGDFSVLLMIESRFSQGEKVCVMCTDSIP